MVEASRKAPPHLEPPVALHSTGVVRWEIKIPCTLPTRRSPTLGALSSLRFFRKRVLLDQPPIPSTELMGLFDKLFGRKERPAPPASPPPAPLRRVDGALAYATQGGEVLYNLLTPHMQQFLGRCVGAIKKSGIAAKGKGSSASSSAIVRRNFASISSTNPKTTRN